MRTTSENIDASEQSYWCHVGSQDITDIYFSIYVSSLLIAILVDKCYDFGKELITTPFAIAYFGGLIFFSFERCIEL